MSEVVGPNLTAVEARTLTDGIRRALSDVWPMIVEAYERKAWRALGYASFNLYCDQELAGMRPAIESAERREVVGQMREAGMSQREIAGAVGVDQKTVSHALRSDEENSSSNPQTAMSAGRAYQRAPVDPWAGWTAEERQMRKALETGEIVIASMRGAHARVIAWAEGAGLVERIDRRSQWGNPFETPADGDRETVIRNYEDHYLRYKPSLMAKLDTLRGRLLTCWCRPLPCHGDALKRWAALEADIACWPGGEGSE